MSLSKITEALSDIAAGKMVLVVDDEDRENEGDLVAAAESITPEILTFMAKKGSGLICVPVEKSISNRLHFSSMVPDMDDDICQFSVSVDLRKGISTGISPADRAKTIRAIADEEMTAKDFVRPGHIFPLRAKEGGVLVRAGHTEASIDLCEMAGLKKAAVICEVIREDGEMARLPDLKKMAKEWDMRLLSIADLIAFRQKNETMVEKTATASLPTKFGTFRISVFREIHSGLEHTAMVMGDLSSKKIPLVRVHSECLTGDVFQSLRCDCKPQLDAAMEKIAAAGSGVLLRMAQEGRGIGLTAKIRAYELQEKEHLNTIEANERLGFPADLRTYGIGAQILHLLGIKKMRLLTNNPRKIIGLSGYGLEVFERVALRVGKNKHNAKYIRTKDEKMGHLQ